MIYTKSETTYPNGLKHIHYYVENMKTIGISMTFRAGSGYEIEPDDFGVAHFLEHMAFNGSKEFENGSEVDKTFGALGIKQNAFTSIDRTKYWIVAPNENFDKAFKAFFHRCFYPLLTEEQTKKEIGIIQEELVMRENEPTISLYYATLRELMGKSSYSHEIIGTRTSLDKMTSERLRNYHNNFYASKKAVLVTYGGIDYPTIVKIVAPLAEALKDTSEKGEDGNPKLESFYIKTKQKKEIKIYKDIDTVFTLKLSRLTPASTLKRFVLLELAIGLLGYGQGAYLDQKIIKELGLATSIDLDLSFYKAHTFLEFISTSKVGDEPKIIEEFNKVWQVLPTLVTEKSVERIRNLLLLGYLSSLESAYAFTAAKSTDLELLNLFYATDEFTYENLIKRLKAATLEEVKEVMAEFQNLNFYTGFALPKK
ncbi:MAG: pitrilysin family protein [Candidatus Dojkabacteria bacterium]